MKKLAFVILIAGGCAGAAYYWQQTQARPTLLEKSITTTPLQFVTMRDVVSATGIVQPRETVVVSSEMPGIVVKLPGKINDRIREGEPIAYLDDRKIKLKLAEAQNAGVLAQAAVLQARALVTQAKGAKEAPAPS